MDDKDTYDLRHRSAFRLEFVLLGALLTFALLAGSGLFFLKKQHDRQAHLAATETVLQEGALLLNALCERGVACSTNSTPDLWRQFSTLADNVIAVRKDVQSLSIARDGVTIFNRQARGLTDCECDTPKTNGLTETEMSQRTLEIGGVRQPVFVLSRETRLSDGSRVLTEATFKREAVGVEELTARTLVSSLFAFSIAVLILSFAACALVLTFAVARDRRREVRARQEEHLAFSGVFANGILHDFRNPMSAVRLDAQMLGKEMLRPDGFRPERVTDLANRIARTMDRMDKVFQEFLFLAKPADEKPEGVDLEQVIKECVDTLAPRVEQAGVTIRTDRTGVLPNASAFPFALRRALLNVLMNAIQFAPKHSEITVTLAHSGAVVFMDVLDRGPGIPAEMRKRVFDMFVTGRPEGTGLGLFLARTAIRRCGGDIQALARPAGGADIRITLQTYTGEPVRAPLSAPTKTTLP
jgi:signal transduction histidine kinase